MNHDDALKAAADGHSVTVGENASWLLTVESVVRTYLEARYEEHKEEHWIPEWACGPCTAKAMLDDEFGEES